MVGAAGLALMALGRSTHGGAAGPVLRRIRARVRQPPEHGAPAAGLYSFSPDASPSRCRPIRCGPGCSLMAVGIAALGALQYAWNFRGFWAELEPPATFAEALAKFWFDVTKEDWRETLVNTVSETGLQHRPAMYWFDLRQQFGVPGVALAAIGFCYVLWRWPRRGVLLLLFYAANMAFAWTYNVGDAYIFFLPSHYVVALCAGAGIAAVGALCLARVESHDCARRGERIAAALSGVARVRHACRRWIGAGIVAPSNCWTSSRTTRAPCMAWTRTGKCRMRSSTSCASAGRASHGSTRKSSNGYKESIVPRASTPLSLATRRSAAAYPQWTGRREGIFVLELLGIELAGFALDQLLGKV